MPFSYCTDRVGQGEPTATVSLDNLSCSFFFCIEFFTFITILIAALLLLLLLLLYTTAATTILITTTTTTVLLGMSEVGLHPSFGVGGMPPPLSNKRKRRKKDPVNLFYYPLYTGYSFPAYPPLFKHPGHAAAWAISRFMKDGLSNIWGEKSYPEFMHFVGLIATRQEKLVKRGKHSLLLKNTKSSSIEITFFEGVSFYTIDKVDVTKLSKKECGYNKLESNVFEEVIACFKVQADYMLSSTSIYKKQKLVLTVIGPPPDPGRSHYHKNHFLEQKLESSSDCFIRPEEKLKYLAGNMIDAIKLESK